MQTLSILDVFHVSPVPLGRPHPYYLLGCPDFHLTKDHHVWNRILLMPNCRVALVNIWYVPLVLIRVHSHLLAEVLLFGPEFTNDLAHFFIHVVEKKLCDSPLGLILWIPMLLSATSFLTSGIMQQNHARMENSLSMTHHRRLNAYNIFLLKVPFLLSLSLCALLHLSESSKSSPGPISSS